jgi:hypothetical protein
VTSDEYLAQRKALRRPPYDPISIAVLEEVSHTAAATYADIGRAVNRIKGRCTTNRRSNVFWGFKTAPYLASFGLIGMHVVLAPGAANRYKDRWRLTAKGAALLAEMAADAAPVVDPGTRVG